jgi:hypothetical protein
VISAAENSNKFQKTRFWKEKSVEEVVTLGPTAQATLVTIKKLLSCDFTSYVHLNNLSKVLNFFSSSFLVPNLIASVFFFGKNLSL